MKLKSFSALEVTISGIIILILAFALTGSLVILNRNNNDISSISEQEICSKSATKYIENEFTQADRIYGIDRSNDKLVLKKISSDVDQNFIGIALLNNDSGTIKVFQKTMTSGGKASYYYNFYNLKSDYKIDSDGQDLNSIGSLAKSTNLFSKNCYSNSSANEDKPFTLKMVTKRESSKKAVLFSLVDQVIGKNNSKSISQIFIRELSAFN